MKPSWRRQSSGATSAASSITRSLPQKRSARSWRAKSCRSAPAACARATSSLGQRPDPLPHRPGQLAAVLLALDDVLQSPVLGVQDERLVDEPDEARPGVGLGEGRLGDLDQLLERLLEHGVDQVGAGREVAVEGCDADVRAPGDLARRSVGPGRREDLTGGRDDADAIPPGIPPVPELRRRRRHGPPT